MIKFFCHNCRKKIGVEENCVGKQVWCPKCKVLTIVPHPETIRYPENNPSEHTVYSVYVCQNDLASDSQKTPSDNGEFTLFV